MYRKITITAAILLLLLAMPFAALGAPVGKISYLEGNMDITIANLKTVAAKAGTPVSVGDVLRTKSKTKAEVTFLDGNVLRLAESTRLRITQYQSGEGKKSYLNLFRGKTQNVVKGLMKNSRYEVHTPTAVCGVRGTTFFAFFEDGVSGFVPKEGTIYGYNITNPKNVKSATVGDGIMVTGKDQPPVVKPASALEIQKHIIDTTPSGELQGEKIGGGGIIEPPIIIFPIDYPPLEVIPASPVTAGNVFMFNAQGEQVFSGTLTSPLPASTLPQPITMTGVLLDPANPLFGPLVMTMSDGSSVLGYIGGVPGSWSGLLRGTYLNGQGGVGFVRGDLTNGSVTGDELTAPGTLLRTDILGTAASAFTTFNDLPLPVFSDIYTEGPMDADPVTAPGVIAGYETTTGGILASWGLLNSTDEARPEGYIFSNPGGMAAGSTKTWEGRYGALGEGFVMLGDVSGSDNFEGGIHHVALSGNVYYLDQWYWGDIGLAYRGAYDDTFSSGYGGYGGNVGLGTYSLAPLAWNGGWGPAGTIYYNNNGYMGVAGEDFGPIGGLDPFWGPNGSRFIAIGIYNDNGPADPSHRVFNSTITGQSTGAIINNGVSASFEGYAAGLWADGSLEGTAVALYSTSLGTAGMLYGAIPAFEGEGSVSFYDAGLGMWKAEGTIAPEYTQENLDTETLSIVEAYFSVTLAGSFDGNGSIRNGDPEYVGGTSKFFVQNSETSLPWGIVSLNLGHGGFYTGKPSGTEGTDDWSAMIGGYGQFGRGDDPEMGYWLADAEGTWSGEGIIQAEAIGTYLTTRYLGTIGLRLYGVNIYDTWIGTGIGAYMADAELAWSGSWGSPPACLYYNNDGYEGIAGYEYGLIGGADPFWQNSAFTAMGTFEDNGPLDPSHRLFNPVISGHNTDADITNGVTAGFEGYAAGTWADGLIDGSAIALYKTSEGDAGILFGEIPTFDEEEEEGELFNPPISFYDSGIRMWKAGGNWMAEPWESELDTETLEIFPGTFSAILAGDFDGEGAIGNGYRNYPGGTTKFYVQDGQSLPWGIFNLTLGYGGFYSGKPGGVEDTDLWYAVAGGYGRFGYGGADQGYWQADVEGDWTGDGIIHADINGIFLTRTHLGDIYGTLYGVNQGDTWIGKGIGYYDGYPLLFGGEVTGSFGYWDATEKEALFNQAFFEGLIGSEDSIFDGGYGGNVLAMGFYDPPGSNNLFTGKIINAFNTGGYSLDLTYQGVQAGSELYGAIDGFYWKPTATEGQYQMGLVSSALSYAYLDDDIGMWDNWGDETTLTATLPIRTGPLSMDNDMPEFNEALVEGRMAPSGGLTAFIKGSTRAFISDDLGVEYWGLFSGAFGGPGPLPATAKAGGSIRSQDTDELLACWIGDVSLVQSVDNPDVYAGHINNGYFLGGTRGTLSNAGHVIALSGGGQYQGVTATPYTEADIAFSAKADRGGFGYWDFMMGYPQFNQSCMEGFIGAVDAGDTLFSYINEGVYAPADFSGLGIADPGVYALFETRLTGGDPDYGFNNYYFTLDLKGIRNADRSIAGNARGLYTKDNNGSYEAGWLASGPINGIFHPEIGMWEIGAGTLTATRKAHDRTWNPLIHETPAPPASVVGSSGITGNMNITVYELVDNPNDITKTLPFGALNFAGGGTYTGAPPNEWSAQTGWSEGPYASYGIVHLTGTSWTGNILTGTADGWEMTPTELVYIAGDLNGVYPARQPGYGGSTWEAVGSAFWESQPLAFSGTTNGGLLYNNGGYLDDGGDALGLLGGTADTLWTGATTPVTFMGSYNDNDNREPYLMYGSGFYINGGSTSGATASEGAFSGYMVGLWHDGNIKARIRTLYIDDASHAGYLVSAPNLEGDQITGNYYAGIGPSSGQWEAGGNLVKEAYLGSTIVSPEDLADNLLTDHFEGYVGKGTFAVVGGGALTSTFAAGDPIRISDQDWGVWNAGFSGGYSGTTSAGWTLTLGGDYNGDSGYWIGQVTGTSWEALEIGGTFGATALTDEAKYVFTGDVLGTHGLNDWQLAGIGPYTRESLMLSGELAAVHPFMYTSSSVDGLDYSWEGSLSGRLGSLALPWGASHAFEAMGSYTNPNDRRVWFIPTPVYHSSLLSADDGGAMMGDLLGVLNSDGAMSGAYYALFVRPEGPGYKAGYLVYDLSGTTYPGIGMNPSSGSGMWTINGIRYSSYDSYEKPITGILPVELYYDSPKVLTRWVNGKASGDLTLDSIDARFTSLLNEPWGVWSAFMAGNIGATPPGIDWMATAGGHFSGSGYWLATLGGDDWAANQDNRVDGTIAFRYLTAEVYGTSTAFSLYGAYDGDGNWQAIAGGIYTETPLAFSGTTNGGLLYNNGGSLNEGGTAWGLLGGTENTLWSGTPTQVRFMGPYNDTDEREPYLMYGSGFYINGGSAADRAFSGYMVGLWHDGGIKARIRTLYIDADGNAGYLISEPGDAQHFNNITGNYYSGMEMYGATGMWEAAGNLVKQTAIAPTNVSPEDLADNLLTDHFEGYVGKGTFAVEGGGALTSTFAAGDPIRILDQPWGVWNAGFSGGYSGTTSAGWTLTLGGDYNGEADSGYWIGQVTGISWDALEIGGTFGATALTDEAKYVFTGDVLGTHGLSDWQLAGIGPYTRIPLEMSGPVTALGSAFMYTKYVDSHPTEGWDAASTLLGLLGGTTLPWSASHDFLALGKYSNPNNRKVWMLLADLDDSPLITTTDGGAILGDLVGVMRPDNSTQGAYHALFVRPDGYGGYWAGYKGYHLGGTFYPGVGMNGAAGAGMWEITGTLYDFTNQAIADITPGDLYYGSPKVRTLHTVGSAGGDIAVDNFVTTFISLVGQPWGVWSTSMANSVGANLPDTGWTAVAGGVFNPTPGYWLANLGGNAWADSEVNGTIAFRYLTPEAYGTTNSYPLYGAYEVLSGDWQAASSGVFNEIPLTFNGTTDGGHFWKWDGSAMLQTESLAGILGGTTEFLYTGADVPVMAMGTYDKTTVSYLFEMPFTGQDFVSGGVSKIGLFGLRLDSIDNVADDLQAEVLGLYLKPIPETPETNDYEAGYVSHSENPLSGAFYKGIGLWEIPDDYNMLYTYTSPGWTVTLPLVDPDPLAAIRYDEMRLKGAVNVVGGSSAQMGDIEGNLGFVATYDSLTSQWNPLPFGIMHASFGADDDVPTEILAGGRLLDNQETPNTIGFWRANIKHISVSDPPIFTTGELGVEGNFITLKEFGTLGDVFGDAFGMSYDTLSYEGIALATYKSSPLLFNGEVNFVEDTETGFGYWDFTYDVPTFNIAQFQGMLGGRNLSQSTSLFTNYDTDTHSYAAAQFIALGTYDQGGIGGLRLFNARIQGNGPDFAGPTNSATDDGFYEAFFTGIRSGGASGTNLKGRIVGLYTRYNETSDSFEAGWITSGAVTAVLHPEIGTWETPFIGDNNLTATRMAYDLPSKPQYIPSGLGATYAPVAGTDGIVGQIGINGYALTDPYTSNEMNWGVWTLTGGGNYTGPTTPSGTWKADAGWSEQTEGGTEYGILHLTGQSWTGNDLSAAVDGRIMTATDVTHLTGRLLGTYPASHPGGAYSWETVGAGTWVDAPLVFNGTMADAMPGYGGFFSYNGSTNTVVLDQNSDFAGFAGGIAALNSAAPVDLFAQGSYANPGYREFLHAKMTTLPDGIYYQAGLGGVQLSNTRYDGWAVGLYKKSPDEGSTWEVGLLYSPTAIQFDIYPSLPDTLWEVPEGAGSLQMATLLDNISDFEPAIQFVSSVFHYNNPVLAAQDITGWAGGTINKSFDFRDVATVLFDVETGPWAASLVSSGGHYSGGLPPTGTAFSWNFENAAGLDYSRVTLDPIGSNVYDGRAAGARVNWQDATTWVNGQAIKGTFSPIDFTWRTVAAAFEMKTENFLDKVNPMDAAQRAAFEQATRIPSFEVGMVNFTNQTPGNLNIWVNDTKFFKFQTETYPRIWASGDVTGNYYPLIPNYTGTQLTLTGTNTGGANFGTVNFNVTKWSGNVWGATIATPNGSPGSLVQVGGGPSLIVNMTGGAAGTYEPPAVGGNGTVTGTAAGTVRP